MSVHGAMRREGAKILLLSYSVPDGVLGSFSNSPINPHNSPARRLERLKSISKVIELHQWQMLQLYHI